jgi:hypothetical protein
MAVFISFALAGALRAPLHPTPFLGGRKYQKKRKSPASAYFGFGHVCIGVGVVEVAVWCRHYMSEILVERKPIAE